MSSDLAIKVQNISKTFKITKEKNNSVKEKFLNFYRPQKYEKFEALKNISFEVKKGEWLGIIGRNGCGKSTLLKILAGIYKPNSGKVTVNGKIIPFLELGVGFNPELTARENIFLNGTILGMTRQELERKFDEIVDFAEIRQFLDMPLKNFSSGMQVRLAFAIAIQAEGDIFLLDEVLAVGDSNFQVKCLEKFSYFKKLGKTVFLVSHDIFTIQRHCKKALFLRNRKVAKIGTAEEVCNEYMHQSSLEEEQRMIKKEKIAIGKNKQIINTNNKIASITQVEFIDKNGKIKNTFETGETLDIKIYYKIYRNIDELNIGIGLYSEANERIFGYNTQMDNFKVNQNSPFLILHFEKMPILENDYYLNVACFSSTEQIYYDIKQKFKLLRIFTAGLKNNYKGFCDIDHNWKN